MSPHFFRLKDWALPVSVLLAFSATSALAQSNYTASEIAAPEWPNEIVLGDMNGNGRQDIIIPQWTQELGRELLIFLQQDDGRYPAQPSRQVEIRSEIVAVTLADLRPEPGKELLLFTGSNAFSLSTTSPGYAGNIRPLFDWQLAASVPDRRLTLFLPPPEDLTGNGHVDLLLPGREGYGIFEGGEDESFTLVHEFSTINRDLDPGELPAGSGRFSTNMQINARDGIIVNIVPRSSSAFENFLSDWREADHDNTLLETSQWMPAAVLANMNTDTPLDIVFENIGNDIRGQVNILSRNADGSYPSPASWQGPIDVEGDLHLIDITGNGVKDAVRIIENSSDWDLRFYRNREGSFDFDRPDQVMRFSGYDLRLSTPDLNGDGRPELSISFYTIPVAGQLRNAGIVRSQLIYGSTNAREGQIFNARPDFRLDENFSATSVRGLSEPIYLEADISGNGRTDALYLTEEGTLAAKAIDSSLRIASQPFWTYVPGRTIVGFEVQDLNGDGVPDFILHHSSATTILVSTP